MPPQQQREPSQDDVRQYIVFGQFETMDTQLVRVGQQPQRLAWCENLQIIGPNNLRSVPGAGPRVATIVGKSILRMYEAHMQGALYVIVFTTDGGGHQVEWDTGRITQFAPDGTFSNPDMTVYAAERILIADQNVGYCTWDTFSFCRQGTVSPNIVLLSGGTGYVSPPGVTIAGGANNVTAAAEVSNGVVTAIRLTDPGHGYGPGDVLTVTIAGGGGNGATAKAVVWPYLGFTPNSLAIFQGHVWISGAPRGSPIDQARILQWTGAVAAADPLGTDYYDSFDPATTSGSLKLADADLMSGITALRSLGNFLYIFGDYSVKQIGSISVSGSILLFTITTVSSDQGTKWKDSIVSYNKLPTFASPSGIFAVFGSSLQKISSPMDGIFQNGDFTAVEPQGATFDLFGQHTYALLLRFFDSFTQTTRPALLALTGQAWYVLSQGDEMQALVSLSHDATADLFASSGEDITPLFANKSAAVPIRLQTALTEEKKPMSQKRALRVGISNSGLTFNTALTWTQESENGGASTTYALSGDIIWTNSLGDLVSWVNSTDGDVTFSAAGYLWKNLQVQSTGVYLGGTLTGNIDQMTLNSIVIEYEDSTAMRSRNIL